MVNTFAALKKMNLDPKNVTAVVQGFGNVGSHAARLLSEKGFDAMTVDEVAAEVGIAKASLYKHFSSKEQLACAAMVQAMADCGCHLNNAYMQHSLLALVVIPDLRISDLGLVDVRKFELVPVVQEGGQEDADA